MFLEILVHHVLVMRRDRPSTHSLGDQSTDLVGIRSSGHVATPNHGHSTRTSGVQLAQPLGAVLASKKMQQANVEPCADPGL